MSRIIGWLVAAMVLLASYDQAHAQPPTYLPWQSGAAYRVVQGNGGGYSHYDQYNRYAWDFALPSGTPVLAAAPGRVAAAGWNNTGFGYNVVVCYGDGTCSRYAHLSRVAVSNGQGVSQAQVVGWSGSTGNSSAPHLHYSLENGRGISIGSSFVEAGVPQVGQTVVSRNSPGAGDPTPVFTEVQVQSSNVLDVQSGDQVRAIVIARYAGPKPIPCGYANFGVRGDSPAKFGDFSAGWWPNSPWRNPARVAAVDCLGDLDPGEYARWDLTFRPPLDTPGGDYLTGVYAPVWEGYLWSRLEIPIYLRVHSVYQAAHLTQTSTPLIAPGQTGTVEVTLRNTGRVTWQHDTVQLGTQADQPYRFADGSWGTAGNRISMAEQSVAPGEVAHFQATIAVPAGTAPTQFRQYLAPVVDGREWFGKDIGIYFTTYVGDKDHLPYQTADYQAEYQGQTNPPGPMQRQETGEVTMTWKNTGPAIWFADGSKPVRLRGIRPQDRRSSFVDSDHPLAVSNYGAKLPVDRVDPGQSVTFRLPVRVANSVPAGSYVEYFRPVAEGTTWFGRDDAWWPFTVR